MQTMPCDVGCHITDPLDVLDDFKGCCDEPQVSGNRLVKSEKRKTIFIYLDLCKINVWISLDHILQELAIAELQSAHGVPDIGLGASRHCKNLLLQIFQFFIKSAVHCLSKLSCQVLFSSTVPRYRKHFFGCAKLDQFSQVKKSGIVRDSGGLRNIMRHHYDTNSLL